MYWKRFLLAILVGCLPAASGVTQAQVVQPIVNQVNPAGVKVDAAGVLRFKVYQGRLTRQWQANAVARLNPNIARPSKLRKVSLNRLEAAVAKNGLTEDMKHLAGLTKLQYVFYFPQTQDIVIAGPAEGYAADPSGRMIGVATGRPTLLLEDMVVALRAFPPSGQPTPTIHCSIDPTQEGLARMQNFLNNLGFITPRDAGRIVDGLRQSLGMQVITVGGVSPRTNFAKVLIESDYRMKLIGIGVERPPVKIRSYVDRANPRQVSRNALQRWYFTPYYDCVRVSPDEMAMELVGQSVKLSGADETVVGDGSRVAAGPVNSASEAFVREFTEKYDDLAAHITVYGQLRNVIDMAVAAAFIQSQDYYSQAGWNMPFFADENSFPVETLNTPKQVETVCTAVWRGRTLMTPIGGGVNIQPRLALSPGNLLKDEDGKLVEAHEQVDLSKVDPDQWWWD